MKKNAIKRFVHRALLLIVVCAFGASTANAQFSGLSEYQWQGYTYNFFGNTEYTSSGTFPINNNIYYNTSSLPGNTGNLFGWSIAPGSSTSGANYYVGTGILDWSTGNLTINNTYGYNIESIVTGSGQGFSAGIFADPKNNSTLTLNNSGTVLGEIDNNDGTAAGVYLAGQCSVVNNAGGTISGVAPYDASGVIGTGGPLSVVNYGTIKSTATGSTQSAENGGAYGEGVSLFTYSTTGNDPIYFANYGTITSTITGGSGNLWNRGMSEWGEGNPVTFVNTGSISASVPTPSSSSQESDGVYVGADNGDVHFFNSGSITQNSTSQGFAVGLENDSTIGSMWAENTGTIASSAPFAIMMGNYSGNAAGKCYVSNSGTISGGWLGLGWVGPMTFYDSGDIHTVLSWLSNGNTDVYITGLPTIDPELDASSGYTNNLVFNLTGTLQYINGNTASGTSFSNLGSQGSIVVSGKTYRWKNFTNVYGTAIPAFTPANGTYKIINQNSGRALCPYAGQTGSGTQMHQWSYLGGTDQQFVISPDGAGDGYYKIIGVQSGLAVEVSNGGTSNGSKVDLAAYNGSAWQKWGFKSTGNGYVEIYNANATNSCLDVSGLSTDNGGIVQLWGIWGGSNQQWALQPVDATYKLIARHSGKAMDAYGANTSNGTQIIQWTYGSGNNQKWTLTDTGSGKYKIIGVQSGKSLDISNWGTANGTKVQLWDYAGTTNQLFTFTATDSGYYRITPLNATSSCLDVSGVSTANGALVQLWTYSGGNNQQWTALAP